MFCTGDWGVGWMMVNIRLFVWGLEILDRPLLLECIHQNYFLSVFGDGWMTDTVNGWTDGRTERAKPVVCMVSNGRGRISDSVIVTC